jgi:hypothetical protein
VIGRFATVVCLALAAAGCDSSAGKQQGDKQLTPAPPPPSEPPSVPPPKAKGPGKGKLPTPPRLEPPK